MVPRTLLRQSRRSAQFRDELSAAVSKVRHISVGAQILGVEFRHFSVRSSRILALAFGPQRACFRSFYGTGQKIHSGLPVLHKCANPACSNRFRRLNLGKLFQVEKPFLPVSVSRCLTTKRRTRSPRRTEHYWLCDPCSLLLTLTFEKGSGMITVPLPAAIRKVAADSCLIELRAATAQT